MLKVRLYRPFSIEHFLQALPKTVKSIAVLDRTKEPGSIGEPLYQDIVTALMEGFTAAKAPMATFPKVIGGRYGLSSKEFTPAMVARIFDELTKATPQNHFTIGINDDVTHTSLDIRSDVLDRSRRRRCAPCSSAWARTARWAPTRTPSRSSAKIPICNVQGYFVYDSKKSGSVTTSHLRFSKKPIHSTYLISSANFVGCHQFSFMERLDVLRAADPGAVFLLNSPFGPDEVWDNLPRSAQKTIVEKKLKFYVIDAVEVARAAGMGGRINTVMQTCFFAISGVLPREEAIASIKHSIEKTYGKRGESVVRKNFAAVDASLENLHEVKVPDAITSKFELRPAVPANAPEFVRNVEGLMIVRRRRPHPGQRHADRWHLPHRRPRSGRSATSHWKFRCGTSSFASSAASACMVCPHAVIRAKVYDAKAINHAPDGFQTAVPKWREFTDLKYTLQVAPEDCTGCGLCVAVCPAKSKSEAKHRAINMEAQPPLREKYNEYWKLLPVDS